MPIVKFVKNDLGLGLFIGLHFNHFNPIVQRIGWLELKVLKDYK
jgi:hypothetical protein